MIRTCRFAQVLALLAIFFVAPSAQAGLFDDIIGIGEDIIGGIIDVGEDVCEITPFLPHCLIIPIIDPPIFCIRPPCNVIEPIPTPEPFYRYYAAANGVAKTKIKEVGYDKGDYAWMVDYDGNGFTAYDTYGYKYTGSAFPIGNKPGKFQLQLDDESLDYFAQYLSERATQAAGTPVTVVLTELPIIKIKELEGGFAKMKMKARGQTATAEGVYPTRYKCKMLGEQGDKLGLIPILPIDPVEILPGVEVSPGLPAPESL